MGLNHSCFFREFISNPREIYSLRINFQKEFFIKKIQIEIFFIKQKQNKDFSFKPFLIHFHLLEKLSFKDFAVYPKMKFKQLFLKRELRKFIFLNQTWPNIKRGKMVLFSYSFFIF